MNKRNPQPFSSLHSSSLHSSQASQRYLFGLVSALLVIWLVFLAGFHYYLQIHFSALPVLTLMGLMLITLLSLKWPKTLSLKLVNKKNNPSLSTFLILAWLLFLNTLLLYFTGGKINPLSHLLLLPLVFAMLLLPARLFIVLALMASMAYVALNYLYVPIMSLKAQSLQAFFSWHLHGSMLVFMLLVLILALVIWPLKLRLEQQNNLLEQKRNQALQQEYLLATASLAAASVHKLSTPLNSLQLLKDMLAAEVSSQQGKDYLAMAGEQIEVCVDSLQILRDKASLAAAKRLEGIKLDELLSELRQEFALLHPKSELIIESTKEDKIHCVLNVDPTFKLAILNLCDNGARYSPDYLKLQVTQQQQQWVFSLTDQGGGLDKQQLNNLGQQQVEDADGMGMGVFISRMIIERFAGQLEFENTLVEGKKGLKITLNLPCKNI